MRKLLFIDKTTRQQKFYALLDQYKLDVEAIVGAPLVLEDNRRECEFSATMSGLASCRDGRFYAHLSRPLRRVGDVGTPIARFYLADFPGQCGAAISYNASVYPKGMGIGKLSQQLRINLARELGYTVLVCTDVLNNVASMKILQRNNWEQIFQFTNARTMHTVGMFVVRLRDEDEPNPMVCVECERPVSVVNDRRIRLPIDDEYRYVECGRCLKMEGQ